MVVAKVRESLAVRKQAAQKCNVEKFNLRKLKDLEVMKQYRIDITKRYVAMEIVITIGVYHFCQLRTKISSNIMLSKLIPYAEEIIGDHQCEFRRNRSLTDHIFCT
jgi:hypothetical protein